jgi:hypothetical protein
MKIATFRKGGRVACLGGDEQRNPRRKEDRIRTGYAGSQSRNGGRRDQALAWRSGPDRQKNRPNQKAPRRLKRADRSSETVMDLETACIRAALRSAQLSLSEPRGGSRIEDTRERHRRIETWARSAATTRAA